ncbi:MAG: DeoR family transcriptional regulator, partial [Candidatus Azambacteria bacterium]|nr:DeoR family transcriptional regulator [Candidatus Azambacteria bacterium]
FCYILRMSADRSFLIELTSNLYRLTLLFPKKEPLRYKMRELATNILAKANEEDLEVLNSFFEVAKAQSWVSQQDILNLQAEYSKLRGEETAPNVSIPLPFRQNLNGQDNRQEKIIEFLKEIGRVKVWEVKQIFPYVSKRTLRRDFESMLNQGVIERMGERNETFYQLKVRES